MKEKPRVGQILYSLNVGNAARFGEQKLRPVEVTKVGRKYFTCGSGIWGTQYYIDGWAQKTEYSANTRLYATEAEWEKEKEKNNLSGKMREFFNRDGERKLSLEQLRAIDEVIEK